MSKKEQENQAPSRVTGVQKVWNRTSQFQWKPTLLDKMVVCSAGYYLTLAVCSPSACVLLVYSCIVCYTIRLESYRWLCEGYQLTVCAICGLCCCIVCGPTHLRVWRVKGIILHCAKFLCSGCSVALSYVYGLTHPRIQMVVWRVSSYIVPNYCVQGVVLHCLMAMA